MKLQKNDNGSAELFGHRLGKYANVVAKLNSTTGVIAKNVSIEVGRVYAKVKVDSRVHTFIDIRNGDILKAASYKAPAKNGVRGNIFAKDYGKSVIDWFGAKYLK